jgi:hypothetical protein
MIRKAMILVAMLGALAACDTPPTREPFPKLTYSYLPPFRLAVARVAVVDRYHPPLTPPYIEQQFPISPAGTAEQWGHDRLQAAGGSATAVYTVLRGDAVDVRLTDNESSGLFSQFNVPQSDRYDLTIAVKLEILDPSGQVMASVHANAVQRHTVAAAATLNDRERLWFAMTEATMKDLNGQLEKSIPLYLQAYLR